MPATPARDCANWEPRSRESAHPNNTEAARRWFDTGAPHELVAPVAAAPIWAPVVAAAEGANTVTTAVATAVTPTIAPMPTILVGVDGPPI